ncbi:MAG: transposase [Candidatus Methanoperedens sp.]|nr:transposase [Candidatus Methanoperedens sp.]
MNMMKRVYEILSHYQNIEPHIPKPKSKRGRKREHAIRVIFNAIFYILRSGCQWRMMPHDFPPWSRSARME